jgi:16S rRNA (uracil1498-N3)-methyltransferase
VNPLLRRSAAHVFVDSLHTPTLNSDDQHHLARVLRLRAGESVSVSDGQGRWRICRFVSADVLEPDTEIETVERAAPEITIGFALPKGDRPEWIVQKLTEIGVDHVVVLHAERSVVRWEPDRAERNIAKLVKVAREASMQSRRVWLPTVSGPLRADQVMGESVSLAEPDGDALSLAATTVLIGPEGGWTPNELNISASHVSLGKSILRVETAALVAAANLSAQRDR